jgi:hypothetical protein
LLLFPVRLPRLSGNTVRPLMKSALRFVIGFILAIALAGSVLVSVVLIYTLMKESMASHDLGELNVRLRHYTDTFRVDDTGEWRMHQASHPLFQMLGTLLASASIACGMAWSIRKLFPRSGQPPAPAV